MSIILKPVTVKPPALTVAAAITRLRTGDLASFSQILVNALSDIQSWANAISNQVYNLNQAASVITSTGKVTFNAVGLTINADQVGNTLTFQVQYSDGTTKSGSINLT